MHTFAQKPKATQQTTSPKTTITGKAHFGQSRDTSSILHLQRTIGNQAVLRLLQNKTEDLEEGSLPSALPRFAHDFSQIPVHANAITNMQPKLRVNAPGDKYEQEADRMADAIMCMPVPDKAVNRQIKTMNKEGTLQTRPLASKITPLVQRDLDGAEEESEIDPTWEELDLEKSLTSKLQSMETGSNDESEDEESISKILQAKTTDDRPRLVPNHIATRIQAIKGGGQPLASVDRAFFEPRFGADLRSVRIHTGSTAAQIADAIQAKAFTVGNSILFNSGHYSPKTTSGRHLLAHELTHTIQQKAISDGKSSQVLLDRSAISVIQTSGPKRRTQKYPFGSLMWHYRKRYVTDRQISRTLQFRYLRKFLGASHLDAIAACRLIHKDISTNDRYKWNKPVRYYLNMVRRKRSEKYDRDMARYGWKPTSRPGITETGKQNFSYLINKRILPFTRFRRMDVEISPSGYIMIGCKSSDGRFYRKYPLISKDGGKSLSLPLSRLNWSKTAGSLITGHLKTESCSGAKPRKRRSADQKRATNEQCKHGWSDRLSWVTKLPIKLPLSWLAIFGDEIELRYYIDPSTKDDCVRRKFVFRIKSRLNPGRYRAPQLPTGESEGWLKWKGLQVKSELRADPIRVVYNSCCPPGSQYALQKSGMISWEGTILLSDFPHLSIKPQIRVRVWQDNKSSKIKGLVTAFARVVARLTIFPAKGLESEARCRFVSCKLGEFEYGQNGLKPKWNPQCASGFSDCLSRLRSLFNRFRNIFRRRLGQHLPLDRIQ